MDLDELLPGRRAARRAVQKCSERPVGEANRYGEVLDTLNRLLGLTFALRKDGDWIGVHEMIDEINEVTAFAEEATASFVRIVEPMALRQRLCIHSD
jgi:hypothetical protein